MWSPKLFLGNTGFIHIQPSKTVPNIWRDSQEFEQKARLDSLLFIPQKVFLISEDVMTETVQEIRDSYIFHILPYKTVPSIWRDSQNLEQKLFPSKLKEIFLDNTFTYFLYEVKGFFYSHSRNSFCLL